MGVKRVKTRVVELMARKQIETGIPVDTSTLVTATKLSRPTVLKWIKGRVTSFDEHTILAFCQYFNCDIGDLLTIVENGSAGNSTPVP
jgi:DNA-binding Xre family transcriptional regulator